MPRELFGSQLCDCESRVPFPGNIRIRPPAILNVTGRECISVRWLAERFGDLLGKSPVFMGSSTECTWLSNASKSFELLGDVSVSLDKMLEATAAWIQSSGVSLGKPTHFEATNGKF